MGTHMTRPARCRCRRAVLAYSLILAAAACEARNSSGGSGTPAGGRSGADTGGLPTTTAGTTTTGGTSGTTPDVGTTAGTTTGIAGGLLPGAADPNLDVLPAASTTTDPASLLPKSTTATQASTMANVRIIGRVDDSNQALPPLFGWPASGVAMAFHGTALAVRLTVVSSGQVNGVATHSYWDLVVDGNPPVVIGVQPGVTLYPISDALAPGNHTVVLTRRTEAQFGAERFGGFLIDAGGSFLAPPAAPAHRMEFIGDSITAGFGDLGTDPTAPSCVANATTENASIAYPALTAAALGAEYTSLSFAGKGVLRNRDPVGDPVRTMPFLFTSAVPLTYSDAVWDFSRWTPEVVVVNLGTNDLKAPGTIATADLTAAYVAFLAQIRGRYPGVPIFCVNGPELGSLLAQAQAAIHTPLVQSDAKIFYLEFPQDTGVTATGATDQGCAYHPSRTTQARMAAQLTAALRASLGW